MRDGDGRNQRRSESFYSSSSSRPRKMLSATLFWCLLIVILTPQVVGGAKVPPERRFAREDDAGGSTVDGEAVTCPGDMFQCKDSRCIPASWVCDNDRDCASGEDEDETHCKASACSDDEFTCTEEKGDASGHLREYNPLLDRNVRPKCIPKRWRCDGEFDCGDHSDEVGCETRKCAENQHECGPLPGGPAVKICIPVTWRCDQQNDCADGSDERDCPNTNGNKTCRIDEHKCDNNHCIFSQWKCDGDNDCGDNSDERDCEHTCDDNTQFTCVSNKFCIPKKWRCDGEHDCIDNSDEKDCTKEEIGDLDDKTRRLHARTCKNNEFTCRNGDHCINIAWKCDNDVDCPDGSDEDLQTCPDKKECDPKDEFRCTDGSCIHRTLRCNGYEECLDGSDEKNCTTIEPEKKKCEYGLFDCGGGSMCINYTKVCDGKAECPNAADENTAICNTSFGLCKADTPKCECRSNKYSGKVCTCARGYNATETTDLCQDEDECTRPGACAQICTNTPGSFTCSCHRDYILQQDGHSCRARGADPMLLLSNRATIRQVDLITNEYKPLITQLDSAVAMDFLVRNNTLIWSDVAQEKIMICHMGNATTLKDASQCQDGNDNSLVSQGVSTPDGLAVDWVHELVYWTDTGLDTISVLHIPTRHRLTLFDKDLDEPRAIAVDPRAGVIFWTDWGDKARVERAGMDGTDRREIVTGQHIKWPNGLALDMLEQRVYWADAKMKMISTSDYWGNDQRMVLQSWSTLKHPFSLSLFEEKLYWTDWDHEGVLAANKFTGQDFQTVVRGISGPMTVRVYHEVTQPEMPNKCLNHPCSDLCLPRPHIPADKSTAQKDAPLTLGPAFSCRCRNENVPTTGDKNKCVAKGSPNTKDGSDGAGENGNGGTSSPEAIAPEGAAKQQGTMAFTTFCILALLSIVVISIGYVWWRRRTTPLRTLNFDNPVYRRTVEETDSDPEIFDPAPATNGGLKLSLDAENYNPTGPIINDGFVSESARQPLTQAMV